MSGTRLLRRVAASLTCFGVASATAATFAGVQLEPAVRVDGQALALASCGVRETLWIDHYVAALYLPPGSAPAAARDERKSKVVRLHIVDSLFLPARIPGKWRRALERELPPGPMQRLQQVYRRLREGDALTISYAPRSGLAMQLNGAEVLRLGGHDAIDSILEAWAEDLPVEEKLRRLTSEHPC